MNSNWLGIDDINKAQKRIEGIAYRTPLVYSDYFSKEIGCQVYLKLENLQKTGAYKVRGAYNKMAGLPKEILSNGVITASAGNHAQGVANAAKELGVAHVSDIIMAETASPLKIDKTRSYGVNVELFGKNFDEANEWAHVEAKKRNKIFIEAFNDWDVMAGQGTVGLEIVQDLPGVDAVIVPVGGGGLISGMAIALLNHSEKIRIIGVEADKAAPFILSLEKGEPTPLPSPPQTMADGIQVGKVGNLTFSVVQELVSENKMKIVVVRDGEIVSTMIRLLLNANLCVEGAGATALAALRYRKDELGISNDSKIVVVLSGGNIQPNKIAYYLSQEIASANHYLNIRTKIQDQPGSLARLLGLIASKNVNIADIVSHRAGYPYPYIGMDEALVEMILETNNRDMQSTLLVELKTAGYEVKIIV